MYEITKRLRKEGCGDLEVIAIDCRSGDTGGANLSGFVSTVSANEDMGRLCEYKEGTEFIAMYMDH